MQPLTPRPPAVGPTDSAPSPSSPALCSPNRSTPQLASEAKHRPHPRSGARHGADAERSDTRGPRRRRPANGSNPMGRPPPARLRGRCASVPELRQHHAAPCRDRGPRSRRADSRVPGSPGQGPAIGRDRRHTRRTADAALVLRPVSRRRRAVTPASGPDVPRAPVRPEPAGHAARDGVLPLAAPAPVPAA